MKYLQINDVHSSDRGPRYRTDTYCDDIFRKLDTAFSIASDRRVDFVLFTGDMFHHPQAAKVSHHLVNRWQSLFRRFDNLPVLIVPGNHDLAAGRMASIERQPISSLCLNDRIRILTDDSILDFDGLQVLGIPWRYDVSVTTIVNTVQDKDKKIDLLALHAPITLEPNPFFQTIQPIQISELARVVSYGHIHSPIKPQQFNDAWFINPGSLARRVLGSSPIDEDDQARIPAVSVVDINSQEITAVHEEVGARPASEVYRTEVHDEVARRRFEIESFVQNLSDASIRRFTLEDLVSELAKISSDIEACAIAEEILYASSK
jgi:DNA repair exonuclease SbcCD nuclease subunit